MAPPFSAFPPPPPPQNGLPGAEFGPGAMFVGGGAADVGAGANGAPSTSPPSSNSVSTASQKPPRLGRFSVT